MLTKRQLQRIAQRHRIGLQAQERDYIQHLFLSVLYGRSQGLLFKGGTALRVLHRSPRYSEDLDFNSTLDLADTKALFRQAMADLARFGVMALARNEWESAVGYSFDLSFQGPLYDGRDRSKGKVRVDTNLRLEKVAVERRLVSPEYDDIVPFILTALTVEHLFAEKVRALLLRGKARDLYDLWFLIEQGQSVDLALINTKLALYETTFELGRFQQQVEALKDSWERDLHPLLAQVPEFAVVQERVLRAFAGTGPG
jgi:predicted nucleotidyltransferase component of viral defense system